VSAPAVMINKINSDFGLDPNYDPLSESGLRNCILPTVKSTDGDIFIKLPKWGMECDNSGNTFIACREHPETKKRHEYHCNDPACPRCYSYWAYREGESATARVTATRELYGQAGKPLGHEKHIVFSPPQFKFVNKMLDYGEDYCQLRDKATEVMKLAGVMGGVVIFHSHRKDKNDKWYVSPHFHLIGWGFLMPSDLFYEMTGWVYKNKGIRKSTKSTISYLLTHVALIYPNDQTTNRNNAPRSITWWGVSSYNKVSKAIVTVEQVTEPCPICGEDMYLAYEFENGNLYFDQLYVYKREKWLFRLNGTLFKQCKIILDYG
jgi:hypothetical protein